MLNILGHYDANRSHCDGFSRRGFLKVGGMAAGGLSLAQLLAIEAQASTGSSNKAIINIFLPGGPSHLDMFDLKPDAPSEIRGEFRPISTNVPGIEICELFPKLAKMADKFAIIRSLHDSEGDHDGFQCMTGRKKKDIAPPGGWPSFGSWISKLQGANPGIPANLSLMYPSSFRGWGDPRGGGYMGSVHAPMSLVAKDPAAKARNMTLEGISLERLRRRDLLLKAIDGYRRDADAMGAMEGFDTFHGQALNILSGGGLVDALDLSKEDPRVLERYGQNDPKYQRDGAPKMIRNFLVARRLVEAGARVISLNYSRWDWHGGDGMNFPRSREEFPLFDQGLSALITDLHERGLNDDVSVVVWGEFGRTPKLNKLNSRDHWPRTSFALVAGGGMKTGQVIGQTDRIGGEVAERPVKFQEVFATLYHNIGIDLNTATVSDALGRPHYLVDAGVKPIQELI
ncbi:DUF1501 domain-containing protein [bacterium]|jgi:hypothetical protein|nr:DUF1501 domain-containing protein [Verrucomicrobiales bacterium]MDB2327276.1 DUF1501 domain-containing protein [bacterium]MDB4507934.1 DUF1501 domain-containing protein [bacterium]